MATTVTFNVEPTNLDHLIASVRIRFGDLTGAVYSDVIIRTALVNAIGYLQPRWQSKYQVYKSDLVISPQPANVPSGYVYANTTHGPANIPDNLTEGSVFRNPYIEFTQNSPPVLQSADEEAIILGAVYILRNVQISSSLTGFISWATEDIRYSNLSGQKGMLDALNTALLNLDNYFKRKIASPRISSFPVVIMTDQANYLIQDDNE